MDPLSFQKIKIKIFFLYIQQNKEQLDMFLNFVNDYVDEYKITVESLLSNIELFNDLLKNNKLNEFMNNIIKTDSYLSEIFSNQTNFYEHINQIFNNQIENNQLDNDEDYDLENEDDLYMDDC